MGVLGATFAVYWVLNKVEDLIFDTSLLVCRIFFRELHHGERVGLRQDRAEKESEGIEPRRIQLV